MRARRALASGAGRQLADAAGGGVEGGLEGRGAVDEIRETSGGVLGALPGGGVAQRARLVLEGELHGVTELAADGADGRQLPGSGAASSGGGIHRPQDPDEVAHGLEGKRIVSNGEHWAEPPRRPAPRYNG